MTTPVKGSISMAGTVCRTAKVPRAISECVALRMYQATAAEFIPLPHMEIRLAAKTNRNERWPKLARIFLLYPRSGEFTTEARRHEENQKSQLNFDDRGLNLEARRCSVVPCHGR